MRHEAPSIVRGALSWNPERIRSLCEQRARAVGALVAEHGVGPGSLPGAPRAAFARSRSSDAAAHDPRARDRLRLQPLPGVRPAALGPVRTGSSTTSGRCCAGCSTSGAAGASTRRSCATGASTSTTSTLDVVARARRPDLLQPGEARLLDDAGGRGRPRARASSAIRRGIAFLDGDRPKLEFMNDDFAEPLSGRTARSTPSASAGRSTSTTSLRRDAGIHVHVYGNGFDDVYRDDRARVCPFGRRGGRRRCSTATCTCTRRFRPSAASWREVRRTKGRWVQEFSRYDAGWSYIGTPFAVGAARRSRGDPEPARHLPARRASR